MNTPRFDHLLLPQSTFGLADAAVRAGLRNLALHMFVQADDEAIARTWVEVYLKPGLAAHELFGPGAAPPEPAFLEAVFRFSDTPSEVPYAGEHPPVHFWLELRGCLAQELIGVTRKKFEDLFNARPQVLTRPHVGLAPHRVVPEDERPPIVAKREPTVGAVGTRVEER